MRRAVNQRLAKARRVFSRYTPLVALPFPALQTRLERPGASPHQLSLNLSAFASLADVDKGATGPP